MPSLPIITSPILESPPTDLRHASDALQEELAAMVDYQERARAAKDPELERILEHHAREEAEHAVYLIDWLRRNDSVFGEQFERLVLSKGEASEHLEAPAIRELVLEPKPIPLKDLGVPHA